MTNDELSVFEEIPVGVIHTHPSNPRREAVADDELLESVTTMGILTPATVAPHPDVESEWMLIAGHCRLDAAVRAGLAVLPCFIRRDLSTDAQQVEAMLVENLRRTGLSPVEEATGYEQLALFGLKPVEIAKATGTPVSTVRSRLKLRGLSSTAQDAVHDGQLTLGDAEALLEFTDAPDILAALEAKAGTAGFAYELNRAREDRKRREFNAAVLAEYAALGVPEVNDAGEDGDRRPLSWSRLNGPYPLSWFSSATHALLTRDEHQAAGCLAYVDHGPDSYSQPQLVCTNPASHKRTSDEDDSDEGGEAAAARRAAWEAEQAARAERSTAEQAARATRLTYLTGHLGRALLPKTTGKQTLHEAFLRAWLPAWLRDARALGAIADANLVAAAGLTVEDGSWGSTQDAVRPWVAGIPDSSKSDLWTAYAVVVAAHVEDTLTNFYIDELDDTEETSERLTAWTWLTGTGYSLSPVEQEWVDRLEDHHTTLLDDEEGDT